MCAGVALPEGVVKMGLTGRSRTARPVNRSRFFSTRGRLQRAETGARGLRVGRAGVLRIALRDHARGAPIAQNAANTGAFKAKPRELPRGASLTAPPPRVGGGGRM